MSLKWIHSETNISQLKTYMRYRYFHNIIFVLVEFQQLNLVLSN